MKKKCNKGYRNRANRKGKCKKQHKVNKNNGDLREEPQPSYASVNKNE